MGKALSISVDLPTHHWVLGSDQVAFNDEGERFHKASSLEDAEHQLTRCSGHWLHFATSLAIVHGGTALFKHVERYSVKFRAMTPRAIRDYVLAEQPVGCAGSFKAEAAVGGSSVTRMVGTSDRCMGYLFLRFSISLMLRRSDFSTKRINDRPNK